jgi:adenylyltransferase/sulfurtransferase
MIHGAIYLFEGQVSVFNHKNGPTYRCYNPETVNTYSNPDPADTGLIGVLPGITGVYMANETIKVILGLDGVLSGQALIFNILDNSFYLTRILRSEENTLEKNLTIKTD